MITIRERFECIVISDNDTLLIRGASYDYPCDIHGDRMPDDDPRVQALQYYHSGDITISTASVKVTIPCVVNSFDWVAEILDYLKVHKDERNIYIDLDELRVNTESNFIPFDNNREWIVEKF